MVNFKLQNKHNKPSNIFVTLEIMCIGKMMIQIQVNWTPKKQTKLHKTYVKSVSGLNFIMLWLYISKMGLHYNKDPIHPLSIHV